MICRFALFALQPINKFTTVFQTHPCRIGSVQVDTLSLLRGYLANFIKPEVVTAAIVTETTSYLTTPLLLVQRLYSFCQSMKMRSKEQLLKGSSSMVFVCSTRQLFNCWPNSHSKTRLSVTYHKNRAKSTPRSIIRLCNRFMTDKSEKN